MFIFIVINLPKKEGLEEIMPNYNITLTEVFCTLKQDITRGGVPYITKEEATTTYGSFNLSLNRY